MPTARDSDRTIDQVETRRDAPDGQPRPAFGLRPWFAFLRRARSLRRFAFAMRTTRVPVGGPDAMWLLAASDASWSVPVEMALDRRARLHGLAPATTDRGLVLRTRSVHGFGRRTPLAVLVLDAAGTVIDRALLRPWTVVVAPAATWITEIPATVVPPPAGTELVLLRRILRG